MIRGDFLKVHTKIFFFELIFLINPIGTSANQLLSLVSVNLNHKSESQLRRYYALASRMEGKTGSELICMLECRLDNLVYRMGFANSIRMARQLVSHRHIRVNGKIINNVDDLKKSIESGECFAPSPLWWDEVKALNKA